MHAEIDNVQQACQATQSSGWEEKILGAHAARRVRREKERERASRARETQNPTSPFPRQNPLWLERGLHFVAISGQRQLKVVPESGRPLYWSRGGPGSQIPISKFVVCDDAWPSILGVSAQSTARVTAEAGRYLSPGIASDVRDAKKKVHREKSS